MDSRSGTPLISIATILAEKVDQEFRLIRNLTGIGEEEPVLQSAPLRMRNHTQFRADQGVGQQRCRRVGELEAIRKKGSPGILSANGVFAAVLANLLVASTSSQAETLTYPLLSLTV